MILFRMAVRNLLVHKARTGLVGGILLLTTTAAIVGAGAVQTIDQTVESGIVECLSGDIQLYKRIKDDLFIFRDADWLNPEVGIIPDFTRLASTLQSLENVQDVVPMAFHRATFKVTSVLDQAIEALRLAIQRGEKEAIAAGKKQVRWLVDSLAHQRAQVNESGVSLPNAAEESLRLAQAQSTDFWQGFDQDPTRAITYLEDSVAPLTDAAEASNQYLGYFATDPDLYAKTFKRFRLCEGTMIPTGKRGLMLNKGYYERVMKHPIAQFLDRIRDELRSGLTFATCAMCRRWAKTSISQVPILIRQLDELQKQKIGDGLRKYFKSKEPKVETLLAGMLQVDDASFEERYQLFYKIVAPAIKLFPIKVGDRVVLSGVSKGGHVRQVAVKVYGTFFYEGENFRNGRWTVFSPLSLFSIIDLITFRELYMNVDLDGLQEQKAMRQTANVKELTREELERLIEEPAQAGASTTEAPIEVPAPSLPKRKDQALLEKAAWQKVYPRSERWKGPVLTAAVILKDRSEANRDDAIATIRKTIQRNALGLEAISWRAFSGRVGKFIDGFERIIWGGTGVVLLLALIVIGNTLMMSTLERVREIGTMRAIGAQKTAVIRLLAYESAMIALVAGLLGCALASLVALVMQRVGISAWNWVTIFLFDGQALRPKVEVSHMVIMVLALLGTSVLATVYPAWLASRIPPHEALVQD